MNCDSTSLDHPCGSGRCRGAEGQATILYPTLSEEARDQVIRVEHPVHERAIARVVVRPIHLGRLEDLVFSEETSEARRRRERYARQLTFEARIGEGSPVAVESRNLEQAAT